MVGHILGVFHKKCVVPICLKLLVAFQGNVSAMSLFSVIIGKSSANAKPSTTIFPFYADSTIVLNALELFLPCSLELLKYTVKEKWR